jgi:hypothetical protein
MSPTRNEVPTEDDDMVGPAINSVLLDDPFMPISALSDWKPQKTGTTWDYGFETMPWPSAVSISVQNPLLHSSTSSESSDQNHLLDDDDGIPRADSSALPLAPQAEDQDLDTLLQINSFDADPFCY